MGTKAVIISAPLSLESEESDSGHRAPNLIQRILSLLSNVRIGSDLSRFKVPPYFNMPKSQLQCFGESVYSISTNMLSKCAVEETCIDRFLSVVGWSISTIRPYPFDAVPYNPILGESHHVSNGTLNVLLEQVSHHPPVNALQATDEKENIRLIMCQSVVPRFHGTHVEIKMTGKRQLELLGRNETYTMNSPNLVNRLFPIKCIDWIGNVNIRCLETGLEAELSYISKSLLSPSSKPRSIKGRIFSSSTKQTIYEINGHWDKTVAAKEVSTGETRVVYNAKETISRLKTPIVKDPEALSESESTVVWAGVSRAILEEKWDKAREAKNCIEDKQREIAREWKSKGDDYIPKYFTVSHTKENGWDCLPINELVPKAPILVED